MYTVQGNNFTVFCFAFPTVMLYGRLKSNIKLTNVVKKHSNTWGMSPLCHVMSFR